MANRQVKLPRVYRVNLNERIGEAQQILQPERDIEARVELIRNSKSDFVVHPLSGGKEIYHFGAPPVNLADYAIALTSPGVSWRKGNSQLDLSDSSWISHTDQIPANSAVVYFEQNASAVRESWKGSFSYKCEDHSHGIAGLRPPQIGAIYAIQSHWSIQRDPATVVLPTGVGKTETMLSALVAERCERLLVVVPTDALRSQLYEKFLTLGLLKTQQLGVIAESAKYPVVGKLIHTCNTESELEVFARKCNVIVTTMSLAVRLSKLIQQCLARLCPTLFIDEAHHLGAPKWREFRELFNDSRIIQFTATPFRNDDEPIGGRRIFTYSLKQAQEDGYFKKILFKPVMEFDPDKKDQAIADAAIAQLKLDFDKKHILMARVASTKRAEEVLKCYERFPEFNPVQIHTGIGSKPEREASRQKVISGESRVVVCVDMLGEGFDLPELKIAAFHDIRKSLSITLQLAGRFTRTKPNLGDATFIANIAEVEVKEELRRLYQHDSDWNAILPLISESASNYELSLWEYIRGFEKLPDGLGLQNVRPATSTVVYETKCKQWHPESFASGITGFKDLDRVYHSLNAEKNTMVIVTTKRVPVDWAQVDEIHDWDWQLYVLHWSPSQNLLFVHNSSNAGFFKKLAQSVAGDDVRLIEGPNIFRCLAGVNRLKLQNVGLREQLGRLIRYTMRAGSDVESGLSETQKRKAVKSNIFGQGYADGHKVSIGCSYKGRIWSFRTSNLLELNQWSESIGAKLCDKSLNPEKVLEGTLVPQIVASRPDGYPISVEWPDLFFRKPESAFQLELNGVKSYLHQVTIDLVSPSENGPLRFAVFSDAQRSEFEIEFNGDATAPDFKVVGGQRKDSFLKEGNRTTALTDFFEENPPTFWFADGASIAGIEHVRLMRAPEPFDRKRILDWNWTGTNIRSESQGIKKDKNSIQYRVVQELKKANFSVIVDDDDAGEAADVVTITEESDCLRAEFWHCKFATENKPGHRIKELYELCGQAQKCIKWLEKPRDLISHLLRREKRERNGNTYSRLEKGTIKDLSRIRDKLFSQRLWLKVTIVQPGLSRATASKDQLQLLAVTESYLMETFAVPLQVIASA